VSEPPEPVERWSVEGLAKLHLRPVGLLDSSARFFVAEQYELVGDAYPRRVGIPEKRPLF
jgi:hypothetical protein